jgi:hypothetical protein
MSIPISGGGGAKEIDFNLASLSGAISHEALKAFVGSLSTSSTEKSAMAIEANRPVLSERVMDLTLNSITASVLKGFSESLEREAEIVRQLRAHKETVGYDPTSGAAAAERQRLSSAQQSQDAYIQKINNVDKGSDGDKVFLAAHQPNATSLHGTNLDPRYEYLMGLKILSDRTLVQLEQMPMRTSAPEKATDIDGLRAKPADAHASAQLISGLLMAAAVPAAMVMPAAAATGLQIEAQVILGAWNALTPAIATQPAAILSGWFASIWGAGQVYQNAAATLEGMSREKRSPSSDVNFAKTYAERLAGSLQNPEFGEQMLNLIASTIKGAPAVAGKDPSHLVAMGKIALLATALALLLKAEEGVVNELNFMGVLSNELSQEEKDHLKALFPEQAHLTQSVDLSKNDLYHTASTKRMLAQQIHDLLDLLPAERYEILQNLIAYMSERPSVERLLDHQEVLHETLHPPILEQDIAFRQMSGT